MVVGKYVILYYINGYYIWYILLAKSVREPALLGQSRFCTEPEGKVLKDLLLPTLPSLQQ